MTKKQQNIAWSTYIHLISLKRHILLKYMIVSNFINIKFVNERVAEELYDLSNKVNSTQTSELNGRNVARFSILLCKILARFRQTVYVHQMTRVSKCSALFSRYFPSHRFILFHCKTVHWFINELGTHCKNSASAA